MDIEAILKEYTSMMSKKSMLQSQKTFKSEQSNVTEKKVTAAPADAEAKRKEFAAKVVRSVPMQSTEQ